MASADGTAPVAAVGGDCGCACDAGRLPRARLAPHPPQPARLDAGARGPAVDPGAARARPRGSGALPCAHHTRGESTAIALGAARAHLLEPLRTWVRRGRRRGHLRWHDSPLARGHWREKGRAGTPGRHRYAGRTQNGFGSQVDSFERRLDVPALASLPSSSRRADAGDDDSGFPGVFIRAPIVDTLLTRQDIQAVAPSEPTLVAREPAKRTRTRASPCSSGRHHVVTATTAVMLLHQRDRCCPRRPSSSSAFSSSSKTSRPRLRPRARLRPLRGPAARRLVVARPAHPATATRDPRQPL
ncbi:hypothetical protein L7F22_022594 [Adiantum nelumboides]|nr:hypothetical protein [Adiantum nelumboides]